MTSPELPTGRPVPDTDDLRLLAEIVNHGAIGLPQAAWNARMSQSEAAARLVQMAERNMPLRLVAEGDRQALWRITQAGPATGGVQLGAEHQQPQVAPAQVAPAQRPEPPRPSGPVPAAAPPNAGPPVAPAPQNPLTGAQPAVQGGYPPGGPGAGPGYPQQGAFPPAAAPMPVGGPIPPGGPGAFIAPGPVVLPPTSAVPPHEQAIAGAVPLGQPPFGTPPLDPAGSEQAEPLVAEPSADASEAPGAEVPPEPVGVTPVESALPEVQPDGAAVEPEASAADGSAAQVAPAAAASTWGIPGSSDWARGDQPVAGGPGEAQAAAAPEPEATQAWSPEHDSEDGSGNQIAKDAALATGVAAAGSTAAPNPAEEWQADQVGKDAPVTDLGAGEVGAEPALANPAETWQATQVAKDATPAVTGFEQDQPPATPDEGQNQIAKDAALAGTFSAAASQEPEPEPEPAAAEPEPEPAPQAYAASPSQVQWQTTTGLSGEQLWVTLLEVIDPGDRVLTQAGYRLEQGERAVLVRTAMANHGPAPHDSLPDHYLVLQSATGAILPKAPMGVGSHPAFRVGVPAGGQADGWTVFLVPADTVVSTVIWSVRPDLVDRTLTWRV